MAKQIINVGTPNKGDGDPLRNAFIKINENFTEVYATPYHLGDDVQFVDVDADTGMVVIQSGFDTSMPVYIKGANCADGGVGGNVIIEAGGPPLGELITGTVGNIELAAQQTTIESNNNMWTFRDDGVLELPEGGDIVDSNGDSVLGGGGSNTGQWSFNGDTAYNATGNGLYIQTNQGSGDGSIYIPYEDEGTNLSIRNDSGAGIELSIDGTTNWTFGTTGLTQFPAVEGDSLFVQGPEIGSENSSIAISAKDNVLITANILGTQKQWQFDTDGRTTFPTTTVPEHSYGVVGDKLGMVAFDSDYIYYCTADYVTVSGSSFSATSNSGLLTDTHDFTNSVDIATLTTEFTATGGGITGTASILAVTPGLEVTTVQFDQSFTATGPITFTGPASQPDIWVRTVWTDTNW